VIPRATDDQLRQWEQDYDQQVLDEAEADGRLVNGYIIPDWMDEIPDWMGETISPQKMKSTANERGAP
jgi:hypothetical protein